MIPRRSALLAGAALLSGCGSLDSILGERKVPLPGDRVGVVRPEPPLAADAGTEPRAVRLPAPVPAGDWPMAGGPSGHSPGHLAFAEAPRQAWRTSIGYGSAYRQRIVAGPVVADGSVFTVDAFGTVAAHALADGARRWSRDTTPEDENAVPLGGGVAVAGGVVHVATAASQLLALDAASGEVRWRVRLPAPARGAPTVAGGRIFVPTVENHLVAFSAEDGRRLWTHRAQPVTTLPLGLPAPAVEGEAVVAGFGTGELFALRARDGRLLWGEALGSIANTSLADIIGITGLPVIDRGRVIAVGLGNTAIAVDLRSGRRLWERAFGGPNGVAAAGDWIFAVTGGGQALALGREDGRIRWVAELDPVPEGSRRRDAAQFGPPLLAGGRVLVPSSRAEMLLLDPSGGEVTGRVPLSAGVTLPMALAGDTLVLLGDDGTLMALR